MALEGCEDHHQAFHKSSIFPRRFDHIFISAWIWIRMLRKINCFCVLQLLRNTDLIFRLWLSRGMSQPTITQKMKVQVWFLNSALCWSCHWGKMQTANTRSVTRHFSQLATYSTCKSTRQVTVSFVSTKTTGKGGEGGQRKDHRLLHFRSTRHTHTHKLCEILQVRLILLIIHYNFKQNMMIHTGLVKRLANRAKENVPRDDICPWSKKKKKKPQNNPSIVSMDVWIFLTCKMIPPYNISDSHWWATGRVWFTFVMVSPYHIH